MTNMWLKSYSQQIIQDEGQVKLKYTIRNKLRHLTFQIIDLKVSPILGKNVCVDLGLLKRLEVNSVSLSLDFPVMWRPWKATW